MKDLLNYSKEQAKDKGIRWDITGLDECRILEYVGNDTSVIIPDTISSLVVTEIADKAFCNKGLTSVVLTPYLTYIGSEAFANNDLVEVVIPNKFTFVEESAFIANEKLKVRRLI